jgi:hypothetical protein
MRGIAPACCARAASGHAAAAPPTSVRNSSLQDGAENVPSHRIFAADAGAHHGRTTAGGAAAELAERAERLGFDSVWASAPAIAETVRVSGSASSQADDGSFSVWEMLCHHQKSLAFNGMGAPQSVRRCGAYV